MWRITTFLGLMLLLWLGSLPVAAFTRTQNKAASVVASLQADIGFPFAAHLSDELLWGKSNELLAAFIVIQPKTALGERGGLKTKHSLEM